MVSGLKKAFIGTPLETAALPEQRLGKPGALAVLASDNMSIAAYASEEIVLALIAAAAVGVSLPIHYVIPISAAAVILIAIVVISYGQTMYAYPTGGGAYTVAKENLGTIPALIGGSSLLVDYVLTVAVSVAAGIAAITSAVPALYPHRVLLCVLAVTVLLLVNLRGARESAAVFAGPVYFFVLSMYVLVIGGLVRYFQGAVSAPPPVEAEPVWNAAYVFLILRAFSHGCVALTGVEAVANGVRLFRPPISRNAAITLYLMGGLTASMFFGISFLASVYGFLPRPDETLLSQIGRAIFGGGPVYYALQAATMAILILAANTPFADFPRLASVMAKDRFLPRQLANLGDRLVFSNGMILLSLAAGFLIVLFQADVHLLIPLYMVGVFIAFTLSQAGMVVHWLRSQERQGRLWRIFVNGFGAFTTGVVLIVVAVVKFAEGAWLILLAIPLYVLLCWKVRQHYFQVGVEMSLADYESPRQLHHTALVPVAGMSKMALAAIEYARSISEDVLAVTINVDNADRAKVEQQWERWVPDVPLVVLESPYRSIHRPLLLFIDELKDWREDHVVTVVIPEFVPKHWWQNVLHNQTSLFLKASLLFKPRIIVTSIPQHLRK